MMSFLIQPYRWMSRSNQLLKSLAIKSPSLTAPSLKVILGGFITTRKMFGGRQSEGACHLIMFEFFQIQVDEHKTSSSFPTCCY